MNTDTNALLDLIEGVDGTNVDLPVRKARYLEFSGAEYARRYARARTLMEAADLDALILAQPTTVRFFTGLQSWIWILPPLLPTVAILPRDPNAATLIDTSMERGGVEETTWLPRPTFYGGQDDPLEVIVNALRERDLHGARLGFELGQAQGPRFSPHDLQRLLALLGSATIEDAGPLLSAVRMLKSPAEIECLREATRLAQVGFSAALHAIRPGITEAQLTRIAAQAIFEAGGLPSHEPMPLIFLTGPERYRQIVQPAVERAVVEGEQVWLDGGCAWHGYRADFMRSGVVGRLDPASERFYQVAVEALEAALATVRPGAELREPCAAVSRIFAARGIPGEDLPYELGHSIGLDHWELPLLASSGPNATVRMRPGMVFCVEPTILGPDGDDQWRSGLFAIEDQVVVTESGVEVLTDAIPRELYRA